MVVPVGGTLQLTAMGQYYDAGNYYPAPLATGITWNPPASTDASFNFANIDKSNGVVTGKAKGSITFTATSNDPALTAAKLNTAKITLTVVDPVVVTSPQLASKLVAGSRSVSIQPASTAATDSFSIYVFDLGSNLGQKCDATMLGMGALQSIVTSSSTTTTSYQPQTTSPVPTPPYTFTLTQPLVADSTLCISETASGSTPVWSAPLTVIDPNDYGRVRTYFLAGVQVSNQQTASASSTAGQYLEAGFNFTWLRAKDGSDPRFDKDGKTVGPGFWHRTPGISSSIDARLSPIPVAAPATNTVTMTPAGGSTGTSSSSITQNLLSSQQSIRFVSSLYFPWKATHWNKHSDYFTVAPLFRGGFATLLNTSLSSPAPTTTPGMTTGTNPVSTTITTNTTVTPQFNSAYSLFAGGFRFGWDRYPASTDEAPQTISQFLVTLGYYSSLPSYVCLPGTSNTLSLNITTACGVPGTPLSTDGVMSRMIIPRIDVEGFAKLPNYPFAIGIDANLAQYAYYHEERNRHVDFMNKAGNDIRIFIGFQIPLDSLISKLGVTPP